MTAFAVFWVYGACGFKLPDLSGGFSSFIFPLFGLPIVLIGLGMLSSPLWSYVRAFKTVYVITNRRAMIFDAGRKATLRTLPVSRGVEYLTQGEKERDG